MGAKDIHILIDEMGGADYGSSVVLSELIRYLKDSEVEEFVEDFRRTHDQPYGWHLEAREQLNANFKYVGGGADWIDDCWALGHSKRIGTFMRLVDVDSGEPDIYFELVERSICLDTGEYHSEQLDTFIEGESQRLMKYIDSRIDKRGVQYVSLDNQGF